MDWIRRNFLFNRKNKSSEKDAIRTAGVAADKADDEFIDIVEEIKPIEPTELKTETEKPVPTSVPAKKSKKKTNEMVEVIGESEADQPATARPVFSKKPRPAKNPISNNQQPNAQLRNNIIHQPR